MALHAAFHSPMSQLMPRALFLPHVFRTQAAEQLVRFLPTYLLPSAGLSIPAISLNIPGFLSDIWDGVLRAVPKKKTSHMKKRHRQLAGKALKDVHGVNNCPACGKPKKANLLCPYCVEGRLSPINVEGHHVGHAHHLAQAPRGGTSEKTSNWLWRSRGSGRNDELPQVRQAWREEEAAAREEEEVDRQETKEMEKAARKKEAAARKAAAATAATGSRAMGK